jgi:hypothetical protein
MNGFARRFWHFPLGRIKKALVLTIDRRKPEIAKVGLLHRFILGLFAATS